jgi:hypothetical protein
MPQTGSGGKEAAENGMADDFAPWLKPSCLSLTARYVQKRFDSRIKNRSTVLSKSRSFVSSKSWLFTRMPTLGGGSGGNSERKSSGIDDENTVPASVLRAFEF